MFRYINTCNGELKPLHWEAGGCMKRLNGTLLERRVVGSIVPKQIDDKENSRNHVANECNS